MKSSVFNNTIGAPTAFTYPQLKKDEEKRLVASLFEQLLIFDQVIIVTGRINFALFFLIKNLGINTVEKLLDNGYIKFMIWTPFLGMTSGRRRDDGSVDRSTIYGIPPLVGGALSGLDLEPENNVIGALDHFQLNRDRKRIFTQVARKNYLVPDGMGFSTDTVKVVLDAYRNNNLSGLGLTNAKDPLQLDLEERKLLMNLGQKVLETTVIAKYNLKSYQNYEHYEICKQNLNNIGKAYKVTDNSSTLFQLEGLTNLQELFLSEKLDFDDVFEIRHLSSAKFYRNWINTVGESANASEITAEYLNEIKGNSSFFKSNPGKFVKNLALFGVSTVLGNAIAGATGVAVGYGLGLLDTFVLDNLIAGKNPSMFIDGVKEKTNQDSK